MDYAKVLKLPQYFRNLQRLSEITAVLIKHGFGDLVSRLNLYPYLETGIQLLSPSFLRNRDAHLDLSTRLRLVCEELGPTFIKFGQLIATRPDMFPESITTEFKRLQDRVGPFPLAKAKEMIESELKRPVADVFLEFEETPLGSASLAQVHKATLHDGQCVIVKIQRPNLDRTIDADLDILRGLAALLEEHVPESQQFSPSKLIEEFARRLRKECDFRREALNLRRFADAFSEEDLLVVPKVFSSFSTRRILVEEFIDGFRPDDEVALQSHTIDAEALASALNKIVLRSIFENNFFHADPHPGNVLITKDGRIAFIDFGAMGRLDNGRLNEILKFLLAALSKDEEKIVQVITQGDMVSSFVDESALKGQVGEILDSHVGQTLGDLNLTALMSEIFEVIRRFGIKPPPDVLSIARAITTLSYIARALDPNFDPVKSIQPYLFRRYIRQISDPRVYSAYLEELSTSYRRLITDLPIELREVLRNLSRDKFTVGTIDRNFHAAKLHQNRIANRFVMTAIGITLLVLGSITLLFAPQTLSVAVPYALLIWGSITLVLVWISVRRSGGTF